MNEEREPTAAELLWRLNHLIDEWMEPARNGVVFDTRDRRETAKQVREIAVMSEKLGLSNRLQIDVNRLHSVAAQIEDTSDCIQIAEAAQWRRGGKLLRKSYQLFQEAWEEAQRNGGKKLEYFLARHEEREGNRDIAGFFAEFRKELGEHEAEMRRKDEAGREIWGRDWEAMVEERIADFEQLGQAARMAEK